MAKLALVYFRISKNSTEGKKKKENGPYTYSWISLRYVLYISRANGDAFNKVEAFTFDSLIFFNSFIIVWPRPEWINTVILPGIPASIVALSLWWIHLVWGEYIQGNTFSIL